MPLKEPRFRQSLACYSAIFASVVLLQACDFMDGEGPSEKEGPFESDPSWSPDGKRIAFVREVEKLGGYVDSQAALYIMSLDGTNQVYLTECGGYEFHSPIAWLRGRHKIAFLMDSRNVYTINTDGTDSQPLCKLPYDGFELGWSPDEERIVFQAAPPFWGTDELFSMKIDETDLQRLTRTPEEQVGHPVWSPDGAQIAFHGIQYGEHGSHSRIYMIEADGSGLVALTDSGIESRYPAWSPDGKQIAFCSNRHDPTLILGQLYCMNRDGSEPRQITHLPGGCSDPAWSPDAKQIAFTYERGLFSLNHDTDIAVINVDGTGFSVLTK